MKPTKLLYLGILIFLTACGNLSSIHRPLNVDDGTGALIDIKQRGIIVSKNVSGSNTQTFVCAEPSPDAMSAYAAETSLSVPEKVKLANAFQEGTSFTGLRTQSIQLLRDGMYRLCEARLSGALDNSEYNLLLRRYQKNMVALLAIEQLTGTVKAPVTLISTTGSASLAQDIEQSEAQVEKQQGELTQLSTELATEKAKGDKADSDKVASLNSKIANKISLIDALKQGITNNRSMLASGTATASIAQQTPMTNTATGGSEQDKLIAAVEKIVISIVEADDLPSMCFNHLKIEGSSKSTDLTESCKKLLIGIITQKQTLATTQLKLANKYIDEGDYDKANKIILTIGNDTMKTLNFGTIPSGSFNVLNAND
ncbi:MAG: hypothetical protein ACI88H_000770 [Cocleimonas sp.]|jgi:hypothetical protein